ncbi:MAG TPA: SMP-30/gluconolactonase/LRE family protein [Chitinophaga sp.]|uniref:SMP-30/gluconolactonase/LRE family protein n=1 Tax=Chitinophaga sp. TaxID=1869181 RepID=UPI002D0569D8|nr:SMP-30/gluconolactonase/LRE family protein [Chitinophaga sp.]HVI46679.1 SMP-30/gluconolactonase/LRE family protein [Chitinophaga sp.]
MKKLFIFLSAAFLGYSASGQTTQKQPTPEYITCVTPPEDLISLPGTNWIIVSCIATKEKLGKVLAVDITDKQKTPATIITAGDKGVSEKFTPHGINLQKTGNGKYKLYVINHGGKESVEVFDITAGKESIQAVWTESIASPANTAANAVAVRPDGSVFISKMYDPTDKFVEKAYKGEPTGQVLKWSRDRGWAPAEEKMLSYPNGLEISPDGRYLFVTEWANKRLWRFPLDGSGKESFVTLSFLPDNLRWTSKGTLLLAGQRATPEELFTCIGKGAGCPAGFAVIEVNPATLKYRTLLDAGDENFNVVSGAIMLPDGLWVGSAFANRLAYYSQIK